MCDVEDDDITDVKRVMCRFKAENSNDVSPILDLPENSTFEQLSLACNALLKNDERKPYLFFIQDTEIRTTLGDAIANDTNTSECVLDIVYQEQAVFKVRPIARCTGSIPGHAEAVISVHFSPDGRRLASGSGDTTVRFWDADMHCPNFTCSAHKNWILCIAWAPDGTRLASACKDGQLVIWDPETGKQIGKTMRGHSKWITSISWEPLHLSGGDSRKVATSSKDATIRIWDTFTSQSLRIISGHQACVTRVLWGGTGLLYSASQDRTISVWRADDGVMCRTLSGHAHWVNTLCLSADYVLRTGSFAPADKLPPPKTDEDRQKRAQIRYDNVIAMTGGEEMLVSGSDDFTMYLWKPTTSKQSVARLTGHQQPINHVQYSPDSRIIASACYDKSIRLWDGRTGKFVATLRGHVQPVYMVSFSADSRLLVSGSADSTLKLWNLKTHKLAGDLPGHADEVYAVDWAADGSRVASGGKDKVLRIWAH